MPKSWPSVMKAKLQALTRSYHAALQHHLSCVQPAPLAAARRLGEQAVTLGLDTLDLARVHEEAVEPLILRETTKKSRASMTGHASLFFAEALTPIEGTHRSAREAHVHLKGVIETLTQRTEELMTSNDDLQREIERRRSVEDSLRSSEQSTQQLLQRSHLMQEELRLLSRRLLSVQEQDRKNISRELHDVIAQSLTGIHGRLATLKSKTTANTQDLHKKIEITQRLVEKSVDIIHRFARDLRPAVLDDLGLIPAMRSHLKLFTEQTGIRTAFTAFAGVEKLDNASRTALYRIAQEALTNVTRHAKASRVAVRIEPHAGMIRMVIKDNGRGFDVTAPIRRDRLGLIGMRERIEMIGGTFHLESVIGSHTVIRVKIPSASSEPRSSPQKKASRRQPATPGL